MGRMTIMAGAALFVAACGPAEDAATPEEDTGLNPPPELTDPVVSDPVDDPGMMAPPDTFSGEEDAMMEEDSSAPATTEDMPEEEAQPEEAMPEDGL